MTTKHFSYLLHDFLGVFSLAVLSASCAKEHEPVAPSEGVLSGDWEGVAFNYSDDLITPDQHIEVSLIHREDSVTWSWHLPFSGTKPGTWDGETVTSSWLTGDARTEFRGTLASTDTLRGDWIVTYPDSHHVGDRWYLARP